MPRSAGHGSIISTTGLKSAVVALYSDQVPDPEGSEHHLFLDVTLNDVSQLDMWPEVTLDGADWKKVYACDKSQIMWSFTSDFSGALIGAFEGADAAMTPLPLLGGCFRWGVKPTITATTGADIDLSLETFDSVKSGLRYG